MAHHVLPYLAVDPAKAVDPADAVGCSAGTVTLLMSGVAVSAGG